MRISRWATPAALVALGTAFTTSCESAECAEEVCFEGPTGGTSSGSGAGGEASGGRSGSGGGAGSGGREATGGSEVGGAGGSSGSAGSGEGGSGAEGAEGGAFGASGEAGSGGEAGAVEPACDPTKAPSEQACLVSDEFAVFVSPAGDDAGTGSKSAPLASLQAAIALAAKEQKLVLACGDAEQVFTAPVVLSGEVTARVFGGFGCGDWSYTGVRTVVAPETLTPALTLEGVSGALAFHDFELRSIDAPDGEGASSIAAVVSETTGVSFSRVSFSAGKGGAGKDGGMIAGFGEAALNGNDADGPNGANPQGECACDTIGGAGGDAVGTSINGAAGLPDYGEGAGEGGLGGVSCGAGGLGGDGAPAPIDAAYGLGAETHGTLTGPTWEPAAGKPGGAGKAGQGGGGGGGQNKAGGGAGGGGACGGCGGKGGDPGLGGGSSIGLLLVDSEVMFQEALITTSNAGAGGDGAPGQEGQEGGTGGVQTSGGCPGGAGGKGASGNYGGGGAGGLSVGILFRGSAPNVDSVTISTGVLGAGGAGRPGGPANSEGLDGDNADTLNIDG